MKLLRLPHRLLTLTLPVVCSLICARQPPLMAQAKQAYAELARLSRTANTTRSASDVSALAAELVKPLRLEEKLAGSVAQTLARRQLEWYERRGPSVHEIKFLASLQRALELQDAPDYLKFRLAEIRKVRNTVSTQTPALTALGAGVAQRNRTPQGIGFEMSPMEAYMVGGLLVFQKLENDDFVRDTRDLSKPGRYDVAPQRPGISIKPYNPRREEFRTRLTALAPKVATEAAINRFISTILEEARYDK